MVGFRRIAIIVLGLFFSTSCAGNYKRLAYNTVAMIKFESIDKVSKDDSYVTGTAFAVDKNHLMTAGHVCRAGVEEIILKNIDNFSVYIIFINPSESLTVVKDFKIVSIDLENDLCLIRKDSHGLLPVTFSSREVKIRDSVFTVGGPAGNFPTETEGFVSLPSADFPSNGWKDRMVMSLDIFSGNSGGPIFDSNGNVIGLVSAGDRRYLHFGIAVKTKYIVKFIKDYSETQLKVSIKQR
jgi:S1-C subfamily serine protease